VRGARAHDPDEDLSHLDAELFGDDTDPSVLSDETAPIPVEPEPAAEPDADPGTEPDAEADSTPPDGFEWDDDDSTAMFGAVLPAEAAADAETLTRRQRRRLAPDAGATSEAGGGSGRLKRLGFAALVVLVVAGVGGLAYAALGRTGDASAPTRPKVEVRGSEVTRTTLRTTTSSSTSTSSTTTSSTTSTTEAPSTTRARAAVPETEPPVTDPPPPPTEPPPPPTDPPPPPPTTVPPTTAPTTAPPVTSGAAPSAT
jgi:hypothetical protein